MSAPAATLTRAAELERVRELLLVILVATIPLAMGTVLWSSTGGAGDFNRRVSISPFDIPLAFLLAVALVERRHLGRWRDWTWLTRAAVALGAVLAVALVFHPSPRGFDMVFRVLAGLAVIDAFMRITRPARQHVLGAVVIVGAIESIIAIGESIRGGALGVGPLEYRGFFYSFGSSTATHAGFDHPYHLAVFLLVAIGAALLGMRATTWRGPWIAAAAICAAGIATTYSRAALLSLGVFVVLVALAGGSRDRKRSLRLLALAVTLGFVFGVFAFGDGWHARASSTAGDSAHVDSDRRLRAEEAIRLVEKQPVVGVGPGRYTIAVASVEHTDLLPAHNIVLQEAAEGGVLAGFLVLALLVAIALRARRDGLEATAVFALPALFLVLDAYPYVFPTGLAVSAVWLGMVFTAREHVTVNDV